MAAHNGYDNLFTVEGVEVCMVDLCFSVEQDKSWEPTMDRIKELVREKGGSEERVVMVLGNEVRKRTGPPRFFEFEGKILDIDEAYCLGNKVYDDFVDQFPKKRRAQAAKLLSKALENRYRHLGWGWLTYQGE